jgi:hypothetical protein
MRQLVTEAARRFGQMFLYLCDTNWGSGTEKAVKGTRGGVRGR